MAKGRMLGLQFDTLFTDGLYFKIARHADEMASLLKGIFLEKGYETFIDSPTNQLFPILSEAQMASLEGKILFEVWEKLPDGRCVTRFATSWATTPDDIRRLQEALD